MMFLFYGKCETRIVVITQIMDPHYMSFLWQVGPHIAVFKTHVDAFDRWDDSIVRRLEALADQHGEIYHC